MDPLRNLPAAARRSVVNETHGEIVRWAGVPSASGVFWRTTPVWLMGFPWLALSGGMLAALVAAAFFSPRPSRAVPMWEYLAMGIGIVFVSSFVLIGLGMVATPFRTWWKARGTVYAITDKRLLRLTSWRRRGAIEAKSFDLTGLHSFERREKRDGSGNLTIVTRVTKDKSGDTSSEVEMLVGVPEVRLAENLLKASLGS